MFFDYVPLVVIQTVTIQLIIWSERIPPSIKGSV